MSLNQNLRVEMGNVLKRVTRPKSRKHLKAINTGEKIPHPETEFSWPLNKMWTSWIPIFWKMTKIIKQYSTNPCSVSCAVFVENNISKILDQKHNILQSVQTNKTRILFNTRRKVVMPIISTSQILSSLSVFRVILLNFFSWLQKGILQKRKCILNKKTTILLLFRAEKIWKYFTWLIQCL